MGAGLTCGVNTRVFEACVLIGEGLAVEVVGPRFASDWC